MTGELAPWAFDIDPHSATPIYVQVARGLRERIEHNHLPCGTALPAERELAAQLGVSRVTIRQALGLLSEQGLLCRKHGSGTFITPHTSRPSQHMGLLSSFSENVRSRGNIPGAKVLSFEKSRPTPHEAMTLGLSPSETIYRIRRLRTSNDQPVAIEENCLPVGLVGLLRAEDVTDTSLFTLLSQKGLRPHRAVRHLRAMNAGPELAALLEVPPGAALLSTERVSWTCGGRPLEFAQAQYRGDQFDFVMEVSDVPEQPSPKRSVSEQHEAQASEATQSAEQRYEYASRA